MDFKEKKDMNREELLNKINSNIMSGWDKEAVFNIILIHDVNKNDLKLIETLDLFHLELYLRNLNYSGYKPNPYVNYENREFNGKVYQRMSGITDSIFTGNYAWSTPWCHTDTIKLNTDNVITTELVQESVKWDMLCPECGSEEFEHVDTLDNGRDVCKTCEKKYRLVGFKWEYELWNKQKYITG